MPRWNRKNLFGSSRNNKGNNKNNKEKMERM